MTANECMKQSEEYFINVYNRYPIVFDHGEGVYLYDTDGKKYLDFGSGIGVCALGYNDPNYTAALTSQLTRLIHTSNLFYTEAASEAARLFDEHSDMDKCFFTNSGTEAMECAIKIARKYYYNKTNTNDGHIVAMRKSFHGRTMGSLAITGKAAYQTPFGPMLEHISFADYNDIDSVKNAITDKTCAIVMETIQGEGGIYPADPAFLKAVRQLCDEKDILLILDEIQCGMGRSGKMFAYQQYGVLPDVMTSAKAVGCGIPVGVVAARGKAATALTAGDHGSTYGGNPLAATAVCTVFQLFEQYHLLDNVARVGAYLNEQLTALAKEYSCITEVRGMGFMRGIELNVATAPVIKALQEDGIIVIPAGTNVLRLLPPLIIKEEHVDTLIAGLRKVLPQ